MGYGTAGCRYGSVLITTCMLRIGITNWYLSYRPLEFLDSLQMWIFVLYYITLLLSEKLLCQFVSFDTRQRMDTSRLLMNFSINQDYARSGFVQEWLDSRKAIKRNRWFFVAVGSSTWIDRIIHPKLCNPSSKCSTVFPGICFSCRGEREVRRKGTKNLRSTCSKGSREKREKRKREEGKESLKSRTVKKNASVKAFWIEGAHARWRW